MKKALFQKLSGALGVDVKNKALFKKAFTHKTYAWGTGNPADSNERLEFLGDSVLNLYISERLYGIFPDAEEGALTRMRSHLVNTKRLAKISKELNLHEMLEVGDSFEGEIYEQTSIMADTFEALVGAIYIDSGWSKLTEFIEKHFAIEEASDKLDSKSRLQQEIQKMYAILPEYKVISEEGLPHKKNFIVEISVQGIVRGKGCGPNKKIAEANAAKEALTFYEKKKGVRS